MRSFDTIPLKKNEIQALLEFKRGVSSIYPRADIILYGSKARGESTVESDLDVMIILAGKVTSAIEHELSVLKFEIELKYDVVIGLIVEDRDFWQSARAAVMPFHLNVDREGVVI